MTDLAIRMQGVCKDYPYFRLQQVNLELPKGQVMGLIGPNGAGKSTSIRIMMGLVHQDSGDVEVLGNPMPAAQIATKWETGFASDDMRLYGAMTLEWHFNLMRRHPLGTLRTATAETIWPREQHQGNSGACQPRFCSVLAWRPAAHPR